LRNKRCFKEIVTIHWFLICRIFQHRFLILDATCYISESSIGICYKLNADEARPDGNGKWVLSAVVIDTEGTVFAASCWYRLILKDSDSAEGIVMLLGLEFSKNFAFVV
jgi:hypothetical protein